jgi:hypothetical protein
MPVWQTKAIKTSKIVKFGADCAAIILVFLRNLNQANAGMYHYLPVHKHLSL